MRYLALPVVAATLSFAFFTGCGDDTGGNGGGTSGGSCKPGDGCPTVQSECLGLVDNAAQTKFALRISHLSLSAPPALANDTVVTGLLNNGIAVNLASCMADAGFPIFAAAASSGDATAGAFSWILQFDTTTGKLTTGGAYPENDPAAGYCFVNENINGFDIAPFEVDAPLAGGKFATSEGKDVVVPIYSDRMKTSVILLPLRGVNIHDAAVSADNECIGKFNSDGLRAGNNCLAEDGIPQFIDGATLDGFVELEQADKVEIKELGGKTLCALLAAEAGPKCARDAGKIAFKGDWCSTTNAAADGTCSDAMRLAATFAASAAAVKSSCP